MSDLPCVQILMGTFNGERFLRQQLDSIVVQTYPNWELLIRDDGSNDNTMDILRTYQSSYQDKIKIVEDNGGNLGGASQNFHRLCLLSSKSFISFADQDDIWHPEKLMRSVLTLGELEDRLGDDTPLLVHHDFTQIDADNNIICQSFDQENDVRKASCSSPRLPFSNDMYGFNMTVNRSLLEVALPLPPNTMEYESVLGCLASQIGLIKFIPEQLTHHRKHKSSLSAVTAFASRTFETLFIDGKIKDLSVNLCTVFDHAVGIKAKQDCVRSYLKVYHKFMSDEQKEAFEQFARLNEMTFRERKVMLSQQPSLSLASKLIGTLVL